MEAFTKHEGLVVPLDRSNVDTDAIIPKQFLKMINRTGYGGYLFDEWRYLDEGVPGRDCSDRPVNEDFVLNQPRYDGASILLARENFGCGSSREHAAWALHDYGIKAVLAPSFADIFFGNACKNGVLPVVLPAGVMDTLFRETESTPGYRVAIDLEALEVVRPDGTRHPFELAEGLRYRLLNGLDDIGVTLQSAEYIHAYEERRAREAPWLF